MPDTPSRQPVRDVVLPLAVVIGLIGNAWWGGVGWGKVSAKLDVIVERIGSAQHQVEKLKETSAAHQQRLATLEADLKRGQEEFRLFKMYTRGRIARLPYRATDDGE